MAQSTKPDTHLEEEKLAHALISRGLLTREEYQEFKGNDSGSGSSSDPQAILARLVKAGYITVHQARRFSQEVQTLMNQQIPGYQLLEKLGQGSMGTVFKARQLSMNRLVAIKVLKQRLAENAAYLERFMREAHLAARFSSNNVIQAIDVGTAGHINYFVMEYVEGTTIKDELTKGKIYEEKEAIDIILQIAQALDHAHRRQLIHRDIKPANIVLTPEGIAKLADLGMARETDNRDLARAEKGMTIGTPYYIAPEQIKSRGHVDSRSDMYSLGATLYHMVTGQPPFPGQEVDEVLRAHLEQELTPPDHLNTKLSSGLGEVVECMMAKKRNQRYQTPADLIIDLECLLSGEPPKLARQRLEASTLKDLAEGEEDEDDDNQPAATEGVPYLWVAVLGGVLLVSVLLNLILLVR
jgi:serine/threonine-protein kinase